jgi:RNA recognition motif-containing protein
MKDSIRLFVGGLNYTTTPAELRDYVADHGYEVLDAHIVLDHATGKSKGFGFITLSAVNTVEAVISDLNGKELAGRKLTVNKALPKAVRS